MSYVGRVLVYGGRGALGATCVSHFKASQFWVGSIDLADNPEAHCNIVVNKDENFIQQEASIISAVEEALNGEKLDGIFCVAGGWAGGNAKKAKTNYKPVISFGFVDLAKNSELMWKQSVCSSLVTASVASKYLKEGAVVQLTGAKAALEPTPGMIGYGIAKAAVHHLTKSLADKTSGLPARSTVVAILPITLDTPMNRKWMPDADFSTWTPLEFVAEEASIISAVEEALNGEKLDGIFCVAGGWAGGNAKKAKTNYKPVISFGFVDLAKNSELMWKQSVCSSLVTASVASKYLKEGAVVQLTGAKAALEPTPGMIGYGIAKAAVHHLTKSLADKTSGLPARSTVVAILPITLDTPMNRKWMPDADFSTWTPLEFVAELFVKWTKGDERPCNGSLLQLVTQNSKTSVVPA